MIANQIRLFRKCFAKNTLIINPGGTRFTSRSICLSDGQVEVVQRTSHINRRAVERGFRRSEDEVEIHDARRNGEKEQEERVKALETTERAALFDDMFQRDPLLLPFIFGRKRFRFLIKTKIGTIASGKKFLLRSACFVENGCDFLFCRSEFVLFFSINQIIK